MGGVLTTDGGVGAKGWWVRYTGLNWENRECGVYRPITRPIESDIIYRPIQAYYMPITGPIYRPIPGPIYRPITDPYTVLLPPGKCRCLIKRILLPANYCSETMYMNMQRRWGPQ
jgi:hypothetical protein